MAVPIPDQTIKAYARSIVHETRNYGFSQVDIVRLINALVGVLIDEVVIDGKREDVLRMGFYAQRRDSDST